MERLRKQIKDVLLTISENPTTNLVSDRWLALQIADLATKQWWVNRHNFGLPFLLSDFKLQNKLPQLMLLSKEGNLSTMLEDYWEFRSVLPEVLPSLYSQPEITRLILCTRVFTIDYSLLPNDSLDNEDCTRSWVGLDVTCNPGQLLNEFPSVSFVNSRVVNKTYLLYILLRERQHQNGTYIPSKHLLKD